MELAYVCNVPSTGFFLRFFVSFFAVLFFFKIMLLLVTTTIFCACASFEYQSQCQPNNIGHSMESLHRLNLYIGWIGYFILFKHTIHVRHMWHTFDRYFENKYKSPPTLTSFQNCIAVVWWITISARNLWRLFSPTEPFDASEVNGNERWEQQRWRIYWKD